MTNVLIHKIEELNMSILEETYNIDEIKRIIDIKRDIIDQSETELENLRSSTSNSDFSNQNRIRFLQKTIDEGVHYVYLLENELDESIARKKVLENLLSDLEQ